MPITVGIPFYNVEEHFPDAIRSVFAQTYQDWELILVDDGSTDSSLEIARSIRDPRVKVISDGRNRRLPYRLNQITANARFELVARMDADDLISPTRFERQLAILNEQPEIDLVTTGVCSITNGNRPIGTRCGSPDDPITGRRLLLCRCAILHGALLGRKAWFVRNPYDIAIHTNEDYELWLRAFSRNDLKIYIMPDPLYYYREQSNVTAKKLIASYTEQAELYKKYGDLGFNRFEIPLMSARLRCKSLIVRLLSASNKMDVLLMRRNRPIESQESSHIFTVEIGQILKTKLPGLD